MDAKIALLTDRRYTAEFAEADDWYLGNILQDDSLLRHALQARGLSAVRVDWADPSVDWTRFELAVFRTTWDYFDRWTEFKPWLERVQQQTTLCNPYELVRWNMDKHYLVDLQSRGITTVASRFIECGEERPLAQLLAETDWQETVIKPCISGAARHTYRLNRQNVAEVEPIVRSLLKAESLILQPFQDDIIRTGEDTLMVFQGKYSHAIRKVAQAGDFRVQDDFGGKVFAYQPTAEQIELAERAMAACSPLPAYGRVDMIRDNSGNLAIMELELIEPELWLRFHPPAPEHFAAAIAAAL